MIGVIMKRTHGAGVALLLVVAALSGGCSSSQMNRIDRHRDIYEQWPLETRQAVLDGKVEVGMTPDMVAVAWGKPSEVVTQSASGDEIWVYKRGGSDGSVYYPGGVSQGIYGSAPGSGIGISTSNRGGTSIGATGGIGMGGSMGGISGGMGGMGGPNTAIVTPPTPPDVREIVFRNGVVFKADRPWDTK